MDKEKILTIVNDVGNQSNKTLIDAMDLLNEEFEKTKDLIIKLTHHIDTIEKYYNDINGEMKKRIK